MGRKDSIFNILAKVLNIRTSPSCRSLVLFCLLQVLAKQGLFTGWVFYRFPDLFFFIYSMLPIPSYQSSVCCLQCILKRNINLVLHFHAKNEENIYGLYIFSSIFQSANRQQCMVEVFRLSRSRDNLGILSELKASVLGEWMMVGFQNFSSPSCLQGSLLGHYRFPDFFMFFF